MAVKKMNTEAFNQIIQGETPVLAEFMAPWCSYCRRIGPALEQIARQREDLLVAQIDIDEEPQLAEREQIQVVPTFLLYHKGRILGSMTAPDSKAKIDAFLREHLK